MHRVWWHIPIARCAVHGLEIITCRKSVQAEVVVAGLRGTCLITQHEGVDVVAGLQDRDAHADLAEGHRLRHVRVAPQHRPLLPQHVQSHLQTGRSPHISMPWDIARSLGTHAMSDTGNCRWSVSILFEISTLRITTEGTGLQCRHSSPKRRGLRRFAARYQQKARVGPRDNRLPTVQRPRTWSMATT